MFRPCLKLIVVLVVIGGTVSSLYGQVPPPAMEVGTVANVDQNFQSVQFQSQYTVAPMVFTLLPNDNGPPSLLRIRDVTTSGFSIAQLEADNTAQGGAAADGVATPSTVTYFAVEPGSGTIGGLQYEAGSISTTAQQHGAGAGFSGPESYDTVTFGSAFGSAPAVLTFVQTMMNSSIETVTTAMPSSDPTAVDFDTALQLAEVDSAGSPTQAETIGYFAIEQGVGTFTTPDGTVVTLESIDTAQNIQALSQEGGTGQQESFSAGFTSTPFAVASGTSLAGADGYWIRQAALTATDIFLFSQEDQHNDTELGHAAEAASIVAFSSTFNTAAVPEPASIAIWSIIGLGMFGFGYRKLRRKK